MEDVSHVDLWPETIWDQNVDVQVFRCILMGLTVFYVIKEEFTMNLLELVNANKIENGMEQLAHRTYVEQGISRLENLVFAH